MSKTDLTPIEHLASEIESFSKKLLALAKAIIASGDDPYKQREQIERIDKTLDETDLGALKATTGLRKSVSTACVEATAEFWQRFCLAATEAGWEVHGTTERRLVARAIFVELKDDFIAIEGVIGKQPPHVPLVIQTLKPLIESLDANKLTLRQFCEVLVQAYDALGGQGDLSLETVFRQCLLLIQPPVFWTTIEPAKFCILSRPAFRWRLSNILAENVVPADGREIRLSPTVNRKDVWELFSPAEGRVVQVGRIALVKN